MALLGKRKKTRTSDKISSATIITSCMEISGDLQGSDTIHIDGKVTGSITVSNTLMVGENGSINGNIKAKNAIINGRVEGSIVCDTLEVMQTGQLSNKIEAKKLIVDGIVNGSITASESVDILINGTLKAEKIESKTITVNGSVEGKVIASELLDIGSTGSVEGEISVKNIKTAEGGKMIGTMSTYEAEKPKNKSLKPEEEENI